MGKSSSFECNQVVYNVQCQIVCPADRSPLSRPELHHRRTGAGARGPMQMRQAWWIVLWSREVQRLWLQALSLWLPLSLLLKCGLTQLVFWNPSQDLQRLKWLSYPRTHCFKIIFVFSHFVLHCRLLIKMLNLICSFLVIIICSY